MKSLWSNKIERNCKKVDLMQKNRPECWVSEMNFCRTMLAEAVFDDLLWHSIAVVIAQQVMFNR